MNTLQLTIASEQGQDAQKKHIKTLRKRKRKLITLISELQSSMDYTKVLVEGVSNIDHLASSKFTPNVVSEDYSPMKLKSLQSRVAEQESRNTALETELESINAALIEACGTDTLP